MHWWIIWAVWPSRGCGGILTGWFRLGDHGGHAAVPTKGPWTLHCPAGADNPHILFVPSSCIKLIRGGVSHPDDGSVERGEALRQALRRARAAAASAAAAAAGRPAGGADGLLHEGAAVAAAHVRRQRHRKGVVVLQLRGQRHLHRTARAAVTAIRIEYLG